MVSGQADHSERLHFVRLLKETWLEWYQSRTFELGAALAFYAIFSVAPVIVLAFTAASLILGNEAAQGRLTQEIESTVGRHRSRRHPGHGAIHVPERFGCPGDDPEHCLLWVWCHRAFQPTAERAERDLGG